MHIISDIDMVSLKLVKPRPGFFDHRILRGQSLKTLYRLDILVFFMVAQCSPVEKVVTYSRLAKTKAGTIHVAQEGHCTYYASPHPEKGQEMQQEEQPEKPDEALQDQKICFIVFKRDHLIGLSYLGRNSPSF